MESNALYNKTDCVTSITITTIKDKEYEIPCTCDDDNNRVRKAYKKFLYSFTNISVQNGFSEVLFSFDLQWLLRTQDNFDFAIKNFVGLTW